jgi:chromosome segregation ATPase
VRGYLADGRRNPEFASKLTDVWTVREDLRRTSDELEKLTNEQNELERASEESRRNLKAIEKNPQAADLRQKLTRRLTETSTRLDAISKRAVELRMALDERRVRFREAVQDLKLDTPLPVKD